jgi:hypothetical protein
MPLFLFLAPPLEKTHFQYFIRRLLLALGEPLSDPGENMLD